MNDLNFPGGSSLIKRAAIFLFIFAATAAAGFSQTSSRVTISVTDANGGQIPGAAVTLSGRNILSRTAQTQQDGSVTFDNIPAGEFRISVDARGFAPANQAAVVNEGTTSIDLVLSAGTISEAVTVTAERTQVTTSETAVPVSVVGREELDRRGINTIGDVFRTLPGTSTVNEGAFQVRPRIRGLDSNRVLILVDGERLNNSRTSTGQSGIEIGLVESSQIESVEVVRGSGSVLYGTDALAGTINIITKDTPPRRDAGFRFGAALDTFFSSNERGRRGNLAVTGSSRFFAFRLAQSLERFGNYRTGVLNGTEIDGVTPEGEVLNSQSHGGNTQATTRFFLNDSNTLKFNYERRRAANIGSPTLVGVFNGFFPFSNRDKFSGRWDSAALTNELVRVSATGYFQKQDRNFTNILIVPPVPPFFPGQYQFSETITNTQTFGYDLQTDWAFGSRVNLIVGTSFFRDENDDRRLLITSTTPTNPNRNTSTSRSVPDATLSNVAAFAQGEFRIANRMKLIGGLRVDRFRTQAQPTAEFGLPASLTQDQIEDLGLTGLTDGLGVANTALTGDAGAVFTVDRNVTLFARVGRSFRTPNIFERFFTDFGSVGGFLVGNPTLVPESGINFDTGVRFRNSRFSASATYFNNYYENFLATQTALDRNGVPITLPGQSPQNPIPVFQTQNLRRARIQGFEADIEVPIKISLGYLTPYGNFSYLRGDDLDADVPLDIISPFRTNAGFRWQNFLKNYYVDYLTRIVVTQRRLSPAFLLPVNQGGNGGPEPGFVTHNLSGGYHFRREKFTFSVNMGISNILNRHYSEQFVFAPARGRSFTFGTTWEIK
ncbi:MAG TPA: TonB-dependent receptor [Pyrinomonadaceae bacterium]|nr:TonB-dependent receptor [Pyrinomonadaceae bacterium]HMP66785.1 TonB-dependent receptor [Pyrinomonadaceae bacterium]